MASSEANATDGAGGARTTREPAPALEAHSLTKRYGGRAVVHQLSFRCGPGTVLGLLGPNGSGKTTTLRMLYGFIEPECGTIEFGGRDFRRHRYELKRWMGVCTQDDTLDHDFTVRQNLAVYARYFRPRVPEVNARIDSLLHTFELDGYADATPRVLSGGTKRRLMIARSVVHHPRVLFLDEPTTGLDPKARVQVWELISHLRAEGLAVVLTTHYMDEAERLCDDLVVLSRGDTVARGTPSQVLGDLVGEHVVVIPPTAAADPAIGDWQRQHACDQGTTVLGEMRLAMTASQLAHFSERFAEMVFTVRPPSLDDLFLRLSVDAGEDRSDEDDRY